MTKPSSLLGRVATLVLSNLGLVALLLIPIELVFGNWVRPFGLSDLRRFSIPSGVTYTFDSTSGGLARQARPAMIGPDIESHKDAPA